MQQFLSLKPFPVLIQKCLVFENAILHYFRCSAQGMSGFSCHSITEKNMHCFPGFSLFSFLILCLSMRLQSTEAQLKVSDVIFNPSKQNVVKEPTVLVAVLARNSAHMLPNWLAYIENLDYPKDRMSIWWVMPLYISYDIALETLLIDRCFVFFSAISFIICLLPSRTYGTMRAVTSDYVKVWTLKWIELKLQLPSICQSFWQPFLANLSAPDRFWIMIWPGFFSICFGIYYKALTCACG